MLDWQTNLQNENGKKDIVVVLQTSS